MTAEAAWAAIVTVVGEGDRTNVDWYDMQVAYRKLVATKKRWLPRGMTNDLVRAYPVLERFVCWTCELSHRCGVSLATSGGQYNVAEYFKVGGNDRNTKYQAHKLSKCIEQRIVYSTLPYPGWDCSHLCHRHKCWNPAHMEIEAHDVNMARNNGQGCPGWLLTGGDTLLCLCQHEPKCLHLRIITNPPFIELDTGVTNAAQLFQ